MIGADRLDALSLELEKVARKNPGVIDKLREMLMNIYHRDEYQKWLEHDQFFGAKSIRGRFYVPNDIAGTTEADKRILDRYGLVASDLLQAKIDFHGNKIHLTDGLWADPLYRVFPFSDESELLCNYATSSNYLNEVDVLIDPACGCGHHGIAMSTIPIRISLDISLRAIAYCRINAVLNNSTEILLGVNDIATGLPRGLTRYVGDNVLFMINMPFAIFPHPDGVPLTLAQDGGDRGIELTLAALQGVKKFSEANGNARSIRCLILTYTLGRSAEGPWEVVEYANSLFGAEDVRFMLDSSQAMWRVNGKKEQPNPMPVEKLRLKARCQHTYSQDRMDWAEEGYRNLEKLFIQQGYGYLGYGLLDIKVR